MSGGGLTTEQKDRAAGVLLGLAIGDALGARTSSGTRRSRPARPRRCWAVGSDRTLPADWRLAVNGWSGVDSPQRYRAADLARLGLLTALGGTAVPGDEQIWQQLDEERA